MAQEIGVVKYDVTDAAIAKMNEEYLPLVINGIEDKEGFVRVHEARMVVKNHRVAVEKKRKELNADALAWQRKVNSEAKRIIDKLEPIETHLFNEEDRVEKAKEAIKAEAERKELERVEKIRAKIEYIRSFLIDAQTKKAAQIQALMDELAGKTVMEEEFQEFAPEAMKVHADTLNVLNQSLIARLTWEREQEAARIEAGRLEKIRLEQEAQKKALFEAEQGEYLIERLGLEKWGDICQMEMEAENGNAEV